MLLERKKNKQNGVFVKHAFFMKHFSVAASVIMKLTFSWLICYSDRTTSAADY